MTEAENKKSKYIFLFLRIAVVAGGIGWGVFWLTQEQRWENLKAVFSRMNPWAFIVSLLIFTGGHFIVSSRWWLLLRAQSISIEFWAAVRLYFLGWFYNNFMPSSLGGDLIRAWYVTKHTHKKLEAALSVFVDRVIGLFSTLVIAGFFYFLFLYGKGDVIPANGHEDGGFWGVLSNYRWFIAGGFLVVLVIFTVLLVHNRSRSFVLKAWLRLWVVGLKAIRKTKEAVVIYCKKPLTILCVFCLTVIMQIIAITGIWIICRSMGIMVSVKYYYVFFTLSWIVGTVPVSIGGAVVVEGFLAYLFVKFAGVGAESALAIALSQRILWMITSLPGAVIHLFGAHLPKDFSIDCDGAVN